MAKGGPGAAGVSPASVLKEALVRQCDRNDELGQELRGRESERWQLLQLLSQRDERLHHEELVAERQRTALTSVRGAVRYYLVLCAFHGWCAHLRQLRMEKALLRIKCQEAAAKMRHACGIMNLVLKRGVERPLTAALHALWFNSATTAIIDTLPDGGQAGGAPELLEGLLCSFTEPLATAPAQLASPGRTEAPAPETPRRLRPVTDTKAQSKWEPSACAWDMRFGSPSPPSEVSTYAASSLSQSAATARRSVESLGRRPLTSASCRTLFIALNSAVARRLFWSMTQWSMLSQRSERSDAGQERAGLASSATRLDRVQSKIAELEGRLAEVFPEPCAATVRGSRSCVINDACSGSTVVGDDTLSNRVASAVREAADSRAEAAAFQVRESEASSAVGMLRSELEEARSREEADLRARVAAEGQVAAQRSAEQAALFREQQVHGELQAAILSLREAQLCAERQEAQDRAHCLADRHRLEASEQACAKTELRLARQLSWREAAHHRISEMVQCGEGLEQERAQLRQELASARQWQRRQNQECEALQRTSTEEAQLCELMRVRVLALEQDHAQLSAGIEEHRRGHCKDIAAHRCELVSVEQHCAGLKAELRESHAVKASAVKCAAQEARNDLQAAWERERGIWAQATDDLEHRVADLRRNLEAAEQSERAEAIAAAEAHAQNALVRRDEAQEEVQRAEKTAWAAVGNELAACAKMKEQLQRRLEEASGLQEALGEQMQDRQLGLPKVTHTPAVANVLAPLPRSSWSGADAASHALESGPPTPQLNELDAYADLLERLQEEVKEERVLRESSEKSLAMLRSSYRLLLTRSTSELASAGPNGEHAWAADGQMKARIAPGASWLSFRGLT